MIKQYRKKPVVISAVQFIDNADEIVEWSDGQIVKTQFPTVLDVESLEGEVKAHVGDYIIRGIQGEFYPCAPDIFRDSYEEVSDLGASDPDHK